MYPTVRKLKEALRGFRSATAAGAPVGSERVYVSRSATDAAWVGIKSVVLPEQTAPAYDDLKTFVTGLGYAISDEGKPGTEGHQSFKATPL